MSKRAPATHRSPTRPMSPFTSFEKHVGDLMSTFLGILPQNDHSI